MKHFRQFVFGVAILIVIVFLFNLAAIADEQKDDFETCVAATNLVFTSYPSKCLSGNRFIVEPMTKPVESK